MSDLQKCPFPGLRIRIYMSRNVVVGPITFTVNSFKQLINDHKTKNKDDLTYVWSRVLQMQHSGLRIGIKICLKMLDLNTYGF
jgi:hypothetical protein